MILACVLVRSMRREGRGEGSEEGGKIRESFAIIFCYVSKKLKADSRVY